jgi:hypothetical protein
MTRAHWRSLAIASAIVFSVSTARAQEQPPTDPAARSAMVQKLSDEGTQLYQDRDYRKASEKFLQAYGIDPDPNLLYNIAKCYEALGDKAAAIDKYEQFVNAPGADSVGRVKAQEALAILKAPAGSAPGQPKDASHAGKTNVPAIAAFAVGGAGVVVGSVFGITSLNKQSDLNNVCTNRQCPPTSKNDITSLKTQSTISTIGFIVGGVGVAAGAVFLIVGRSGGGAEKSAGVSPYVGLGSAGITGSF